jgi:hypothetical protein
VLLPVFLLSLRRRVALLSILAALPGGKLKLPLVPQEC